MTQRGAHTTHATANPSDCSESWRCVMHAAARLENDPGTPALLASYAAVARGKTGIRPVGAREIPGDAPCLFRSRALGMADAEEIANVIAELSITSIYDLRKSHEVALRGQFFPLGTRTISFEPRDHGRPKESERWLRAGVIGHYGAPEERMRANYRRYVEDYPLIGAVIRGIATEKATALVHCENGKDRTGVICAVAMYAAGAPWEAIVADYLATNIVNARQNAEDACVLAEGMSAHERAILDSFLEARPSYLAAFFDEAEKRYGSLEAYLANGLRLSEAQRHNLAMLVPGAR